MQTGEKQTFVRLKRQGRFSVFFGGKICHCPQSQCFQQVIVMILEIGGGKLTVPQ